MFFESLDYIRQVVAVTSSCLKRFSSITQTIISEVLKNYRHTTFYSLLDITNSTTMSRMVVPN